MRAARRIRCCWTRRADVGQLVLPSKSGKPLAWSDTKVESRRAQAVSGAEFVAAAA